MQLGKLKHFKEILRPVFEPLQWNDDPAFVDFRERHLDVLTVVMVSLAVLLVPALSLLDEALGVANARDLFWLRMITAGLTLLNLGVDFLWGRTRRRMKLHVFLGYYIVLVWAIGSTVLVGDPDRAYWAQFNLILVAWYVFAPFSYREVALQGLVMIVLYNLAVLYALPGQYTAPVVIEYNAYFAGNWLIGLIVAILNNRAAALLYASRLELEAEKKKSDDLLHSILPGPVAERLKSGEQRIADRIEEAGVLFADIVGFTELTARVSPEEIVGLLDEIFKDFDALAERFGLEKIKTIGDAYMVVGGLVDGEGHPASLAEMALAMRDLCERPRANGLALQLRIGLDLGPVVAGVIGSKKPAYDLWGDAVNTASRMESLGGAARIHVTAAVHARLADRFVFTERGEIDVKGKGPMRTYWLEGRLKGVGM